MIKKIMLGCSIILLAPALANAKNNNGQCATQKAEIQKQIDYARTYNHPDKVAGLQTALSQVEKHCTDAGRQARDARKIADKEKKVNERKAELEQAKLGGSSKKIAQKTKKLNDAIYELEQARQNAQ